MATASRWLLLRPPFSLLEMSNLAYILYQKVWLLTFPFHPFPPLGATHHIHITHTFTVVSRCLSRLFQLIAGANINVLRGTEGMFHLLILIALYAGTNFETRSLLMSRHVMTSV